MRDSNPRYPGRGIPDFESSAFDHSANLPKPCSRTPHVVDAECDCKSNTIFLNNKKLSKKTLDEVIPKGRILRFVIFYLQLIVHAEIIVESVFVAINNAKA